MNSLMDHQVKDYMKLGSFSTPARDVSEPMVNDNSEDEAKHLAALVEWLNSILPSLKLSMNASEEELRACLIDGTVLCQILNRLRPGSVIECVGSDNYSQSSPENVKRFLAAMDNMRLPRFQVSDIEQGPMKNVMECLLTLRALGMANVGGYKPPNAISDNQSGGDARMRLKLVEQFGRADNSQDESLPQACPTALIEEERRKSILESKFQHALRSPILAEPSAALTHHVGHKFHEVFQLKQGCYADLPPAKISEMMQSNSLDNAPTQSLLSVMNGILDESSERKNEEIPHHVACLLRKVARELERRICTQAEHLRTQSNLFKAREEKYQSRIRVLEALAIGTSDETRIAMNQLREIKVEKIKMEEKNKLEQQDVVRLMEEKDQYSREISSLRQELEIARMTSEKRYLEMKAEAKEAQQEHEERLNEVTHLLTESRNKVKELEAYSETNCQRWNKREHIYQIFMEFQLGALRELKFASQSIKQEILKTQKSYSEEFHCLGVKIRALADASENYDEVLAENRRIYNELQDLKGNIRVYCRIRPFLPGQTGNQSTIEYIGENGELVVVNPSTHGKDGRRSFKFNKVYDQAATQADVFCDTQPLIRSVLDGYNVCIFAYGQTGAGKTYTMTGPDGASEEEWGVNYRALNDLFHISKTRSSFYTYEIGVQMVEIYNEQVRDLLSNDGPQKRLGILSTSQAKGLAVPDACMHPVESTSDVLQLMETGLKNRAKGATTLNERSSRSHSIVTIHVWGTDLKAGASLHGSLHLVDLAGSERVDRSEVTGDRLREAQHINKSLSALGDVIFALAQKSSHVPYRNSKLTQVLQSSLGGQAKTLMFVQLNPDVSSYSETVSTLKFAERVSGVELGAARSSKEGIEVTELMEQVASFKDIITKKDEEIDRLQDLKNVYNGEKRSTRSLRHGSFSPGKKLIGSPQRSLKLSGGKGSGLVEKSASDQENFSENSENEGRLSDLSDSGLSMGTDTDCSVESNVFSEGVKPAAKIGRVRSMIKIPRTPTKGLKDSPKGSAGLRKSASGNNLSTGLRKSASGSNISAKPPKRWH